MNVPSWDKVIEEKLIKNPLLFNILYDLFYIK